MSGPDFPYVWHWQTMQDPQRPAGHRIAHPYACRVGQRLRVIARGAMNSALIEFQSDGLRSVVSRNALKRAQPVSATVYTYQLRLELGSGLGEDTTSGEEMAETLRAIADIVERNDMPPTGEIRSHRGWLLADAEITEGDE
jgi:hypothetical protein